MKVCVKGYELSEGNKASLHRGHRLHQVKRPIQDLLKKVHTLALPLSLNETHRDCLYEGSTQYGSKWLACHFLGQSVHDIG